MTERNQIPLDTFTEAIGSLDRESFAALVGETYAATADEVSVDGPRITLVENDRRTELLVVSAASDLDTGEGYDTVVTARDSLIADRNLPADATVVTPADLRQRLLYAVSPGEADAITTRFLDVPMRSTAYDATSAADTATDAGGATDTDDTPIGTETGPQNGSRSTPGDTPKESVAVGAANTDRIAGESPDDATRKTARSQPSDASSSEALTDGDRRWILFGAVGLVVVLGLAAIGAGFAGSGFISGGADGIAGVDDGTTTDPDPSESAGVDGNTTDNDGGDATAVDETVDRTPTNATARAASVAPTCERSALHVVQLQMNAFRYNDNTTNAGILAARQFSSPSNRAAVGSADQFVSLFDMPRYAPMLTYDTVQYSVPRADEDTTNVEVVTRENGTVTGRYNFRLSSVPSDEAGVDTTRNDAECWMTSGVTALPV